MRALRDVSGVVGGEIRETGGWAMTVASDSLRQWRELLAAGGDPSSQDAVTTELRNKLLAEGKWRAVYALDTRQTRRAVAK